MPKIQTRFFKIKTPNLFIQINLIFSACKRIPRSPEAEKQNPCFYYIKNIKKNVDKIS
jgi:hypothetical protein